MKYLDLFAGIGGFALGAYWAGWRFEEHYFSEVDKYATKVYRQRFPDAVPLGDIKKINTKTLANGNKRISRKQADEIRAGGHPVDNGGWVVTGGFPCQDISFAGKGAGIFGRKSNLWFEMWRIIGGLRPRVVIIENVGAITIRGLDTLLSSLAEIRYDCEWQDIRASDMGAPHKRERIWIVAYPEGQRRREEGQYSERSPERSTRGGEIPDTNKQHDDDGRSGAGEVCREQWEAAELSGSQDVANTMPRRCELSEREIQTGGDSIVNGNRWAVEPAICELVAGLPSGLDRYQGRTAVKSFERVNQLKCLGNSIVPQIAQILFEQIATIGKTVG